MNTKIAYIKKFLLFCLIGILLIIFIFPIYWILATSLKRSQDAISIPPKIVFEPVLDAYVAVYTGEISGQTPGAWYVSPVPGGTLDMYFLNSVYASVLSTSICVILGATAAYAFSRYKSPRKKSLMSKLIGSKVLMPFLISLRLLPPIAIIIPLYILFANLRMLDTALSVALAHTALNLPFAIWMLWGFFEEVPIDLDEAAMIDGCNEIGALFRVVLPVIRPGIVAVTIFCVLGSWNEFMFALILTSMRAKTLPILISNYTGESLGLLWPYMCVSATIVTIPVMVFTILAQKYMIKGMTFGAIKG